MDERIELGTSVRVPQCRECEESTMIYGLGFNESRGFENESVMCDDAYITIYEFNYQFIVDDYMQGSHWAQKFCTNLDLKLLRYYI